MSDSKSVETLEREEYEKMMQILGLSDSRDDYDETDYFDAWNFGKTEEDYEFIVTNVTS